MLYKSIPRALLATAAIWMAGSAALAAPAGQSSMPLGRAAPAPAGYVAFCVRQPLQCGADSIALLTPARASSAEQKPTSQLDLSSWQPAATGRQASGAALSADAVARPAVHVTAASPAPSSAAQLAEQPFELTDESWKTVKRINSKLNRAMRATTDLEAFGVADYWDMPVSAGRRVGDCEDFVLEKRQALIEAGIPRRVLNIGVVVTERGESHAVLVLTTPQGDFVLDNLNPRVEAWDRTGYRWIARQVDGQTFRWAMIDTNPAPVVVPPPALPAEGLRVAAVSGPSAF